MESMRGNVQILEMTAKALLIAWEYVRREKTG